MHKKKQRAYNKYRKSGISEHLDHFQDIRKSTQKETRRSYRKYINSVCLDSSKDNKNSTVPTALKCNKGFTTNDKETAEHFNDFFTSIGNNLANKFDNHDKDDMVDANTNALFEFELISPEFVFDELCKMNINKSTGVDNLSVMLLKLAAPVVCKSLAYICNLSLLTSTFPSKWKQAKVTPIFKAGDKDDVNNYRPISVLPIVSKVIERSVHNQLYEDTHH